MARFHSGARADELHRVREYIQIRMGLKKPRYTHPFQRPYGYFPGLSAKPWLDPKDFPWTSKLDSAFATIKGELSALRNQQVFRPQHQKLATDGAWNVFYFYTYGHKVVENCRRCPETTRIIESIQGATSAGLVYFSAMAPGTHVEAHCGPINTRLRCHFGLAVPPDCVIRVGEEIWPWIEGKNIIFDDSFEHEVWNKGTVTRLVLVIDIWHPELTSAEIEALKVIARFSGRTRKLRKMLRDPTQKLRTNDWWKEM